jgi:leucyl-tRNA synthetase
MQLDIYCIRVLEQILKDKGFAPTEEPFKKLINQGMILGLVPLCIEFYGVGVLIKMNDMQKPFISKTKYDKIVKGDKEETKHKKSFI